MEVQVTISSGISARIAFVSLLLPLAIVLLYPAQGQTPQTNKAATRSVSQSSEERGRYIVEDVAICGQCHTPRDSNGASDRTRWLEGAPVWLKSAESVENWPLQAPRIAGILPGTDGEMITLLTTGLWRGAYLRPPMPQFRMSQQDAAAVVAYLKAAKPTEK